MVLYLPDSWLNWKLEISAFEERVKLEYLEKNFSEQRREPKTNSNPYTKMMPALEPGPLWWEASALTIAPPLSTKSLFVVLALHKDSLPRYFLVVIVFDFAHELLIGTYSYCRVVQSVRKAILKIFLSLMSLQVTDMMQKALFDYMKHKFSGR